MMTTNLVYGAPSAVAFGRGTFVGAHGRYIVQSAPLVTLEALGPGALRLTGPAGRAYAIEAADELASPWLLLTNVTIGASPYDWNDPQARSPTRRFYRARLVQ